MTLVAADTPRVSVVIPTRGRPELLLRAIDSVLRQSVASLEILVVVDGPDPATEAALATVGDPRLRILRPPATGRPGRLRNLGAKESRGRYVAFLDDDDAWYADKLERQLAAAGEGEGEVVVACRAEVRTPTGTYVWPRRAPEPGEPLSEFLFLRRTLFKGEGFIQSSGLLASRSLMARLPFDEALTAFEDWDWVLAVDADPAARFVMVYEPLYIHYAEERRPSLSSQFDIERAIGWARRRRDWLTPRSFAGFCLVMVSAEPALRGMWSAFPRLLGEAFRGGRPTLFNLALFLGMWLLPRGFRRRLRGLFGQRVQPQA